MYALISDFPGIDEEIEINQLEELSGGSAANYIIGVARLGASTGFIGKVGDDSYGTILLNELIFEKIDVSQVQIEKTSRSGMCLIPVDRNGNRIIFSFRGANAKLQPEDIKADYLAQASHLHITSPPQHVAEHAAKIAKDLNLTVSYDPGGKIIRKGLSFIESTLPYVDMFFPSSSELSFLFPDLRDPVPAGLYLIKTYGIKLIAIKQGAHGCLIISKDHTFQISGLDVSVIDTTGAGDAFAAAFTVAYHRGWDLITCASFANAAGALTVTRVGARSALPTEQEINALLQMDDKK